jgi:pimeloyl-ACP methyl ester carboxylesterase
MLDGPGPTSRVFFSQRLRLHYVDWGNPAAPPLVLVHGGRDHCRNWDWVAVAMRREWHVIAPDLRGHGDSQWSTDGSYGMPGYIYDLAQLIDQQRLAPATIVAHSLGANIAIRYAGIFPDKVRRLVAIEGLGPSPEVLAERGTKSIANRMERWIGLERELAARRPRRYASLEEAFQRMHEANRHLSPEQARHLTQHGVNQNEDGSYTWKFDNYVRVWPPTTSPRANSKSSGLGSPVRRCSSMARKAGHQIRPKTDALGTSRMARWSPSKRPGIGSTMTGWTHSWIFCAGSSDVRAAADRPAQRNIQSSNPGGCGRSSPPSFVARRRS